MDRWELRMTEVTGRKTAKDAHEGTTILSVLAQIVSASTTFSSGRPLLGPAQTAGQVHAGVFGHRGGREGETTGRTAKKREHEEQGGPA